VTLLFPDTFNRYSKSFQYEFIFLQHGVIKDDISSWLNTKRIRKFVTSTQDEFESIVSRESNYRYTENEVILTGLPRFDALMNAKKRSPDYILIAPTWRKNLKQQRITGSIHGGLDLEKYLQSKYHRNWDELVSHDIWHEIGSKGITTKFMPHPSFSETVGFLNFKDGIEVINIEEQVNYFELIAGAAIVVTDFS
jgi:CDP-glycerol glycerophosphotransferase (TagB/SpsB family)